MTIPEFTFKFEDSILPETYPFAVKPNDPRYYNNALFSLDNKDNSDFEKSIKNNTKWEQENIITVNGPIIREENPRNIESKFKDTDPVIAELERRTEYNPLFVPVNQDLNNDIYFIAIVAGCSAAAIIYFRLIALTWCRLKRGAKAAADIEYPAYGVTGPNKEISPRETKDSLSLHRCIISNIKSNKLSLWKKIQAQYLKQKARKKMKKGTILFMNVQG